MKEIERTFLVIVDKLPKLGTPICVDQMYLSEDPCTRIRMMSRDGVTVAFFTVKGQGLIERTEIEVDFPADKALEVLLQGLYQSSLCKNRYPLGRWVIDEFRNGLDGLWLAEIELSRKKESFDLPDWLGPEVTYDPRFTNMALARDGIPEEFHHWVATGEWHALA